MSTTRDSSVSFDQIDTRSDEMHSTIEQWIGDLEPRTRRAVTEEMSASLLEKGGRYEVQSASGNRYEAGVDGESCTCPDRQLRSPVGRCKHLRRVDHESSAVESRDRMADSRVMRLIPFNQQTILFSPHVG